MLRQTGKVMPVRVRIRNFGEDFEGVLGMNAYINAKEYDRYERNIVLPAGSEREFELPVTVFMQQKTFTVMFTLSGVPVLYSGDEIAQENDYSYHDDPRKADDSRYLHRGDMDWKKAEKRKAKDSPEGRVFAQISAQEKIRAEYGVFDDDADVWILNTGNSQVIGIGRYYRGEQLLALFNFSRDPQVARILDETMYHDLDSGKRCKIAWRARDMAFRE